MIARHELDLVLDFRVELKAEFIFAITVLNKFRRARFMTVFVLMTIIMTEALDTG